MSYVACEIQAGFRVQNIQSIQIRAQQATSRNLLVALHPFQSGDYTANSAKGSGVVSWENPATDKGNQES